MARPTTSLVVALLVAPGAGAQQASEIDITVGRTILEDEWRGLGYYLIAVDWARGVLYVHDDEEPDGVMVFSLETGEWVRTISTPRGEGPYEFSQGRVDLDLAPNGGLYVSGFRRVVEYDSIGVPVESWTPAPSPLSGRVCNLDGSPAVPTREGVVRRGPDGESIAIGPPWTGVVPFESALSARIACRDGTVYVAVSYSSGPDSIRTYRSDGEVGMVAVPAGEPSNVQCLEDGVPCPHWSRGARVSFDGRGNIVILGIDQRTHGAIINPRTGCYTVVRNTTLGRYTPVAVHGDSVLVFHHPFEKLTRGNRTVVHIDDSANGVSMRPIRGVGTGCLIGP